LRSLEALQIDHDLAHRLVAIRRIFFERLLDNQAQLRLHCKRRWSVVCDAVQHIDLGIPYKRPTVAKQFVEHYAERKNIASGIYPPTRRLLRRHVSHSPQNDAWFRRPRAESSSYGVLVRRRIEQLRQPEVHQLCVAALRHQDIRGLDIPVQDAGFMGRRQPVGDSDQQRRSLPR